MACRCDAIIIGTGQAGPALAHRFARAGDRVAIVERKRFGGACVNTGCIPTKSLILSRSSARTGPCPAPGTCGRLELGAPLR